MSDPLFPYGRQWIGDDDVDAVTRVLREDYLTTGPLVDRFERALAEAAGTAHAVAVSSGSAALHCGYRAMGLRSEVSLVTSPLTFVATASIGLHLGARVVFADVESATGNLDPDAVDEVITKETELVVPADYAGHPADYPALRRVAERCGASLMADAAHSFGARLNGEPVTTLADAATLSFHPVKLVTTAEGGALVTNVEAIRERALDFRNHGLVRDVSRWRGDGGPGYYEVQSLGLNYRLADVLCALGLSQLNKRQEFLARRRTIAERYTDAFRNLDGLEVPRVLEGAAPAWHLYVLRVREAGRRQAFFNQLRGAGLGVQVHFPPVHLHPLFQDLGYGSQRFPVAENFSARAVSIPLFPAMSDDDVTRVIEIVSDAERRIL